MKPRVENMSEKDTNDHEKERPKAEDLPDGSNSDGSQSQDGADTVSGGGADDE
jgi:hypothetical protein